MFSILSDGIYKDKILAVIREYCCNAYDSHVTAGKKDIPFKVQLPNYLEPTFSVTDYGSGIDPENIGDIYWTYGRSSKTQEKDTIGALGLGSKSAFAYTKSSFIVRNNYNGQTHSYFCFINEHGEPEGSEVGVEDTTECNGVTVEFAVRPEDIRTFYERFDRFFMHWKAVKPVVVGNADFEPFKIEEIKLLEGDKWYLAKAKRYAIAVMGNVPYPIESDSIPNIPEDLKFIADNPFVIEFPLGSLEFSSSRESLSYSEFTSKEIIDRLTDVKNEIISSFRTKVFAAPDLYNFVKLFKTTYDDLKQTVNSRISYNYASKIDDMFCPLLTGYDHDGHVTFNGKKIKIKDLIAGKVKFKFNYYQNVCVYFNSSPRGNLRYHQATRLSFSTNTTGVQKTDFCSWYSGEYNVGDKVLSLAEWRPNHISNRKKDDDKVSTIEKLIKDLTRFDVESSTMFDIEVKKSKLIIILNDVGSVGRDRYKNYVNHRDSDPFNTQYLYADFYTKVTSLDEAKKHLEAITKALNVSYVLLSTLPDHRAPSVKVIPEKGTIKVDVKTFSERSYDMDISGDFNGPIEYQVKALASHKNNTTKVFTLESLRQKAAVPFFIRSRKHLYDDVKTSATHYVNGSMIMNLANHFGMYDEMHTFSENGDTMLEVIIISPSQHAWLLNKKVKLVSLREASRKTENDKIENFEEIKRAAAISKVYDLGYLLTAAKKILKADVSDWSECKSLLKNLIAESAKGITSDVHEKIARYYFQTLINPRCSVGEEIEEESEKIVKQINARYPMISLTSCTAVARNASQVKILFDYVEQIDFAFNQAVHNAKEEIEENCLQVA
jgi:hypothetical protein